MKYGSPVLKIYIFDATCMTIDKTNYFIC